MSATSPKPKPILFISHNHADSNIADTVRTFITTWSGGRVAVFQSSSPHAEGPKIGRNLNVQLREALWNAGVIILLYTTPGHDWTYCTWECGVAMNPQSPDTKIILFHCTDKSPALFIDQVNVNVRNPLDIQKFVKEFLTAPDFFPGFEGPLSGFNSDGPEIAKASAELADMIEPCLPPQDGDEPQELSAYPFLQFELGLEQVEIIREADGEGRREEANEMIKDGCLISASDQNCHWLFGLLGFENNTSFGQLVERWCSKHPQSPPLWADSLCGQLLAAAKWELPPRTWTLMQSYSEVDCHVPVLNRIRKLPASKCMQFDIYFYRLPVGPEKKTINIAP